MTATRYKEVTVIATCLGPDGPEEFELCLPPPGFEGEITGTVKQARDLRPTEYGFEEEKVTWNLKFTLKRKIPKVDEA